MLGFIAGAALSIMNIIWWKQIVFGWGKAKPSNFKVLSRLAIKMALVIGLLYCVILGKLSVIGFCMGVACPLAIYSVAIVRKRWLANQIIANFVPLCLCAFLT